MSHSWHTNTAIMEESLGDPCEQIRCYRTRRDRSPSGCATRARRRLRLTAIIEASERHAVSGSAVAALWQGSPRGYRQGALLSQRPCQVGAHGDRGSERATRAAILVTAADCGHGATGHGVIGSRASTERYDAPIKPRQYSLQVSKRSRRIAGCALCTG